MILIDVVFLAALLNAVFGTLAFRVWSKMSKRMEAKSEYDRIYRLLRMILMFYIIPGPAFILLNPNLRVLCVTSMPELSLAGRIAACVFFGLALIWIIGIIKNLMGWVQDVRHFLKVCRDNEEISNRNMREWYERISTRQHVYQDFSIYQNPQIHVPVVFGIFKRTILLPAGCECSDELQIILEHEMVHAKHYDLLYERIALFIQLILWPVSGSGQLTRELENWSETACDISVCGCEESVWSKQQYFNQILRWAQKERSMQAGAVMALSGEGSAIHLRIHRMLQYEKSGHILKESDFSKKHYTLLAGFLALALLVIGVSGIGNIVEGQYYTAGMVQKMHNSFPAVNRSVTAKGSLVLRPAQERSRMIYLKEGESCVLYMDTRTVGSAHTDAQEAAGPIGFLTITPVLKQQENGIPFTIGRSGMGTGYHAQESGWYRVRFSNQIGQESVRVNYVIKQQ